MQRKIGEIVTDTQGGRKEQATAFEGSHLLLISSKCLNKFP